MSPVEAVELARAYVALSNAHRVDLIESMFADDAIYRSSAVGEHRGASAIAGMMREFFRQYPDVHWDCESYRCTQNSVHFDFRLVARSAQNGERLERRGHERIDFNADGFIVRLEVDAD